MSRVVLYSGEGCSLCADAAALLDELGVEYETASNPEYRERIPVITVDGAIVTEGRISERALRAALRRRRA